MLHFIEEIGFNLDTDLQSALCDGSFSLKAVIQCRPEGRWHPVKLLLRVLEDVPKLNMNNNI